MLPTVSKNKKTLVLIDYANIRSSAAYMKKRTDLAVLYKYLRTLPYVDKIAIYYGTDPRNPRSITFMNWLKSSGYEVNSKDVKYMKLNLKDTIFNSRTKQAFSHLDPAVVKQMEDNISLLEASGAVFEQQKCNLDIEIALDIANGLKTYDSFILFSGDSDFENVLKLAKANGKHVTVIALRKFTSGEVIKNSNTYINLTSLAAGVPGFLYDSPQ